MLSFIIRRFLGLAPVFFGITIISFFVIHLAPGRPTDLAANLNPKVSYESRVRLEHLYGLDKPLLSQYIDWLNRFIRFDFGRSFVDDRPVSAKIFERLPITLLINILTLSLIMASGIFLGIISAIRENSWFDKISGLGVFITYSAPQFWLALIFMSVFCVKLGWLPVSGIKSVDFEYYGAIGKIRDVAWHLILPVTLASMAGLAGISRYMRSSMINIMRLVFIRALRSKGVSENRIIFVHAFKNAILPVVTLVGLSIPGLIGGSVIFESIFSIPGMGRLFYESAMARDYSTIMGILMIGTMLTLIGNLLADTAYFCVDPRIRVIKHDT